ncbi:MAG: DinB family protein [bacterium]|nr:DinB family protein [bacterium]
MNVKAMRHWYAYHFAENRALWDRCIVGLTQEQFTQPVDYSLGSVRNHIVHLVSVDDTWFSGLRGLAIPDMLNPLDFHDRAAIRTQWDRVEADMRAYLDALTGEQLNGKPFIDDEDKDLIAWQVLLHVVNHGTDHRAQVLRILHDMGVKTTSQDYIFYVYDHP